MKFRNTILLSVWILIFSSFWMDNDGHYHRVRAIEGDNIHTLLHRYELAGKPCNFEQFYKLNSLNAQSKLVAKKKYFIPVLIYDYNGKSIRSTLGIKGWEKALRIKKYNEDMLEQKHRKMTLVKSNILWVPHHELHCDSKEPRKASSQKESLAKKKDTPKNESPSERKKEQEKIDSRILARHKKISGIRKYPIFGKDHAYIPLKDNKLRGKVFYIVSGHGGPDVGAVGKHKGHQLCEDEYAYDVSLRLARNLLEHGAIAYMITRDPDDGLRSDAYLSCDYDEYCWGDYKIPRSQKSRLYQRSDAINERYEVHKSQGIKHQTTVVIHIDSRSKNSSTDVFFYHYPGSSKGRKIAKNVHKTFARKYKKYRKDGKYKGTVTPRDLHMLREPKTTSVFIELGNIRNKYDQQRFMLENNRQALANWLYEGLVN